MYMQQCLIFVPWILTSVHAILGWKKACDLTNCQTKSRSLFEIVTFPNNIKICVCSNCASRLTGIDIAKFAVVDTYIDKIKPHFKLLRNLTGAQPVNDHKRPDYISKFYMVIGDQRIFISIFKNGRCLLIINDKQIQPNLSKSFINKTAVTEFAVEYVNNQYQTKLFNYIIHGQNFVMP